MSSTNWSSTAAGSVRRWLLVHPAEAGLGTDRLSAASPRGSAIIGPSGIDRVSR